MLGGFAERLFRVARSQILGLTAQLIAAAPILLVSIFLSRAISLAAVADFALLIGVSSVAFTLAMIGLRSWLMLDRFREFSEAEYCSLRIIGAGFMGLIILTVGLVLEAPFFLTIAVVLLRIGDAALDLVMAIDQVRRDARAHMYGYLKGSSFKLVMILIALVAIKLIPDIDAYVAFTVAIVVYTIFAWNLFFSRCEDLAALFGVGTADRILGLIGRSAVFAIGQITCAFVISLPRFVLPAMEDRNLAGAAGAALTISTFFGMAYFAVWLRWAPRMGKLGVNRYEGVTFCIETCVVCIAMLGVTWAGGVPLLRLFFGLSTSNHLDMALSTLMASVVFYFVLTLANLFKVTKLPWLESIVFLSGAGAMSIYATVQETPNTSRLLLAASGIMVAVELLAFLIVKHWGRRQPSTIC